MKSLLLSLWEVLEVVIVSVLTVILIRTFLMQPFLVRGASMESNFSSGDYLIVDELTYRFREPRRGEVVVFEYPQNPSVHYIKRLIGLPGETVTIRGGAVFVYNQEYPQGLRLEETYLSPAAKTSGNTSVKLEEGEYFVLGDNRNYSADSRLWGKLPKDRIVGLARLRLLPVNKAQAFSY